MNQLGFFQSIIQEELPLDIPPITRKGNPNWKPKFKSGKTQPLRVPIRFIDKVRSFITSLDQGDVSPLPSPAGVKQYPVDSLHLDPKRFQYKVVHGKTGSTGSLTGVQKWDENLGGIILVWFDPYDGLTYVVNGHNRVALAQSLGVESLIVRFLAVSTATEARLIGAIANIAEGRGTAIDAAKLFRDNEFSRSDLINKGIPLREKIASDGLALASLSPVLFNSVVSGEITTERGVIIGELISDHDDQLKLVELIEKQSKNRKITNDVIRELAQIVNSAESHTEEQFSLFGTDEVTQSLAIEKAELQAYVRQRLSRERKLFSTVSRTNNAEQLERGNNKIDTNTSQKIAQSTEYALRVFDQLKNVVSPVSTALNLAAKNIATGIDARKVRESLYSEILDSVRYC